MNTIKLSMILNVIYVGYVSNIPTTHATESKTHIRQFSQALQQRISTNSNININSSPSRIINQATALDAIIQFEVINNIDIIYEWSEEFLNIIEVLEDICGSCGNNVFDIKNDELLEDNLGYYFGNISKRQEMYFGVIGSPQFLTKVVQLIQMQDLRLNQQGYFTYIHKWFFFTDHVSMLNLQPILGTINNVAVIVDSPKAREILIYTALWKGTAYQHNRTFNLIGYSNGLGSIKLFDSTIFPNMRYGFNKQHFLIGTQLWEGYNEIRIDTTTNSTYFYGSFVEVAKYLSKRLNFTYTITLPADGKWGALENGTWNGLVGITAERKVDLVLAALTTTFSRSAVMDFADFPIHYEYSKGLYKKPKPIADTMVLYSMPFTTEAWVVILGGVITYVIVLWMVTIIYHTLNHRNINMEKDAASKEQHQLEKPLQLLQLLQDILIQVWITFQAFFAQSVLSYIPPVISIRFLWQGFYLYAILIGSIWIAKYISFIAVELYPIPFKTLEDLTEQEDYKFGTLGASSYVGLLESSNNIHYQKIWNEILKFSKEDDGVLNSNHSMNLEKVLKGKYVYLIDEISAAKLKRKYCDVDVINDNLFYDYYSIGLQKNSAYKKMVNEITLEMYDNAILDIFSKKFVLKGENNCGITSRNPIQLQVHHIYGILDYMARILAVAVMLFIAEKIIFKLTNS